MFFKSCLNKHNSFIDFVLFIFDIFVVQPNSNMDSIKIFAYFKAGISYLKWSHFDRNPVNTGYGTFRVYFVYYVTE